VLLAILVTLIRLMMTNGATGSGPQSAVMPRKMPGNAPDKRTLDASFGVPSARQRQQSRQSQCNQISHGKLPCFGRKMNARFWRWFRYPTIPKGSTKVCLAVPCGSVILEQKDKPHALISALSERFPKHRPDERSGHHRLAMGLQTVAMMLWAQVRSRYTLPTQSATDHLSKTE
jgi:hypothetical protein